VDSKFGVSIETGQADAFVKLALEQPHLHVAGYHCHVGSQVFWEDVFERSVLVMMAFIRHMQDDCGYLPEELDLGGGYGVRYIRDGKKVNIAEKIGDVAQALKACCREEGISLPKIQMEPGRSIVADAGMTVYTVGSVKRLDGFKNFAAVNGGMTDNPRYVLYGSEYTVLHVTKNGVKARFDLVGRCCESGDIIQPKVMLPADTCRGDLIAVCVTGAYNYSMASNYNRFGRPPVVMLKGGESYVAVRRETAEDLLALDL
jgi:Diaminopimelate decarboxylase